MATSSPNVSDMVFWKSLRKLSIMVWISVLAELTEQQESVDDVVLIIEFLLLAVALFAGRAGRGCGASAVGAMVTGGSHNIGSMSMLS